MHKICKLHINKHRNHQCAYCMSLLIYDLLRKIYRPIYEWAVPTPTNDIWAVTTVWRIEGKIIGTVLWCIVYTPERNRKHTHVSSLTSYKSTNTYWWFSYVCMFFHNQFYLRVRPMFCVHNRLHSLGSCELGCRY